MTHFAIFLLAILLPTVSLSAADAPIVAIAIAPDGKTIVTGSNRGVAIHVPAELTLQDAFDIQFSNVHDLSFSPDGQLVAISGGDPGETGIVQIF
ncbi:MAG: WD40 repeat domain-containing protein, partial [Planctomycetes bacterium]|nr:WD40 repeat domain-containing protein [Planctomycetota bacterium]